MTYLGINREPICDHGECSNPNRDDHFTCPGCYNDLGDIADDLVRCPKCEAAVIGAVVQTPSASARLLTADDYMDYAEELEALGIKEPALCAN